MTGIALKCLLHHNMLIEAIEINWKLSGNTEDAESEMLGWSKQSKVVVGAVNLTQPRRSGAKDLRCVPKRKYQTN